MNPEDQTELSIRCEIDEQDWLECEVANQELTLAIVSGEECVGGVTIGRTQLRKLIDFLERSKESVEA